LHSRSEQHDDGLYIDVETAIPLPTALAGNEQITIQTLPGGYRVIGPPRQVRLRHGEHMDPNQYITEVQFPVEKQRV